MFHTKVDYELFHLGSLVDHFLQKFVVINYPVAEGKTMISLFDIV